MAVCRAKDNTLRRSYNNQKALVTLDQTDYRKTEGERVTRQQKKRTHSPTPPPALFEGQYKDDLLQWLKVMSVFFKNNAGKYN